MEKFHVEIKERIDQDTTAAVEHDQNDIILVPAGDNTPRWLTGERLHHLFEQR
jgi:hypothetical protein